MTPNLYMLRPAFLVATIAMSLATRTQAQAHMTHHHPRGAKIVMMGTVVDPVCAFAFELPDSAQARCSEQHPHTVVQPVLLANGELYVLGFDRVTASQLDAARSLLGKRVKVDGTVYPAGASYLIVIDSVRVLRH